MNVLPIILSNGQQNVVMATVVKILTVNSYIRIRALINVRFVQDAENGIVQRYIHVPELDFVRIRKIVRIWFVCVYIRQNVLDYSVQLELIVVTCLANSNIHLNDNQYVINEIHVRTLIVLIFMDQIGIRVKQGIGHRRSL